MAKLSPFERISFSLSVIKRCEKLNTTVFGSIEQSVLASAQSLKLVCDLDSVDGG
jgi:hypothetical protein